MSTPPQPLHVLMTTDAVGGVWVFTSTLARELCRRGIKVTLVTLGPPPSDHQLWMLSGVEGLDFEITDLALEWMEPEGLDLPRARFRLAALEKRIKPDLVHLNGYREACLNWSAPVLLTAHSCVRSWWEACRGSEPMEPRWESYVRHVQSGLAMADMWAAPTKAFRNTIQDLYAPPKQGLAIWNGIDEAPLVQEKQPFILAAGRLWDEAKNIGLLAKISAEIDWPLRIAGAAHLPGTAEIGTPGTTAERIGDLYRSQLLEQMERAAVFAACPLYEPFGLTILEAAVCGCALVLSDIPTLRELWDGAALFADPRDPAAFRDTLQEVCRNEELRSGLQRAAKLRSGSYSVHVMADAYCELYAELVAVHAASGPERQAAVAGGQR